MHFLITGHTGFKGAWLTLLLKHRGHTVSGISLDPIPGALFEKTELTELMENDFRLDIRDFNKLQSAFKLINPDVVIHMAAQPLVRESYRDPLTTFETNVIGTLNVLRSSQQISCLKALVIVTTDKVYKNVNQRNGYVETDQLGGHDPYSTSKAMADLLTQSWRKSFSVVPTAIARAGNVIGGGDVSPDRLIPDLVNAYKKKKIPHLRFPEAVRPWQHVLDCVNGYLALSDALIDGQGVGEWNFGPMESEIRTVAQVSDAVGKIWGVEKAWELDAQENPHEAGLLLLDSEKARKKLNWRDKLNFEESITWTTKWYQDEVAGKSVKEITLSNIKSFESKK